MANEAENKDLLGKAKGFMKSHNRGKENKEGITNPSDKINEAKPKSRRFDQEISAEKLRKAKDLAIEQQKAKDRKNARKHIVQSDETLSHISLKYYGSAVKDKWMIIYEANKEIIGDNPNIIRPGMELIIPDIKS